MADWLRERAKATPDRTALVIDNHQWSFQELDTLTDHLAALLDARGARSSDHIAVLMPNNLEYVLCIYALMRVHAVLVPVNTRLTPHEIHAQIHHTQCKMLIFDSATHDIAQQIDGISLMDVTNVGHMLESASESAHFDERDTEHEDWQSIIFTSGTSGTPKGVIISYGNLFWSATASAFRLGLHVEDQWLCTLPLYHVGGLSIIVRSCLYGTAVVLQQGFDIARITQIFESQAITLISLVPTMLYRLLQQKVKMPDSLRLILLGGAAADANLIQVCAESGLPVATTYGLTEACSQVATMLPEDVRKKPGSVGKGLLFTDIKIVDENEQSVEAGQYGEVVVTGRTVAAGYYENPEATARAFREAGLFTGDIGYKDQDGHLWIVQRRSDLIVTGGENVFPAEVEQVISGNPGIKDVCVVGIPDSEWGQRVAALVVRKRGYEISEDAIIAECRSKLAGYKIPKIIRFADQLPQTASGKVHRLAVADLLSSLS